MAEWIKNSIIYHVLIDRFAGFSEQADAGKDHFCGGNLNAIEQKLDYIQHLGANTLWLSPFYGGSSYHGYHITDYTKVEPRFGSLADLKSLIAACKQRNMRIIADVVPNHCSVQHPWFQQAQASRQSEFFSWFYFKNWPHHYLSFLDFSELPKLNLENPVVADWMIHNLCYWASLGFDGYRIDHVTGIPDTFLIRLKTVLLTINPDFVLIGEAWTEGMHYKHLKTLRFRGRYQYWKQGLKQTDIQKHYIGLLDGVLDFGWRELILEHKQLISRNPDKLRILLGRYNQLYPAHFLLPRFFDNHDTSRLMHMCNQNADLFRELLAILFEQQQPVIIYYGTEAGMTHQFPVKAGEAFSDLRARLLINWQEAHQAYAEFIAKIASERKQKKSLPTKKPDFWD